MPDWCRDSQRAELLHHLQKLGDTASPKYVVTKADTALWRDRFVLPLLGGAMSGRTHPQSLVAPTRHHGLSWTDVAYRLTLGWSDTKVELGATEVFLALERF